MNLPLWLACMAQTASLYGLLWFKRQALRGGPPLTWLDKATLILPALLVNPLLGLPFAGAIPGFSVQTMGWLLCLTSVWQLKPGMLSRSGVYQVVRHPLYTGYMLWVGGWILIGGLTVFNALVWAWLIYGLVLRLRREETWLRSNTDGYAQYQVSTPYRLVPFVY